MDVHRFKQPAAPVAVGAIAITGIGIALVAAALAANQEWLDRHFLPSFLLPHAWYVRIETAVRVVMAASGLVIVFLARRAVSPSATRIAARTVEVAAAAVLALAAGEFVLRRADFRRAGWILADEEPKRQLDPHLGWTFVPSREARVKVGGREVEYAFDAAGYRARRAGEPVDPARPTILFVGESVMFGEGLEWDESIPAQVGAMLGVQSANLAVHGFGTDQSYLRLEAELPRFRRPVGIVALFMTTLFGRNLDEDRPHLGPALVWLPPQAHWRLATLAKLLVPYRSNRTVERGVAVTREALGAIVTLARSRHAMPLIVVPQFGTEEQMERTLRRRILDEPRLPYVLVELHADWRLPWDRHPDARAAHVIAAAIAAEMGRVRRQVGR